MKKKCFVVLQKPKALSFGGKNKIVLNSNIKFVFVRLLFIVKGSFMPIFKKNINYLKMKTLT